MAGGPISLSDFPEGVRLATPSDGAALARIYGPIIADTAISFETDVPDASEMARRVEETTQTHPWLVMEDASGVIGYAYGCPHRKRVAYQWSCEVSAYVDARARGTGVGRMLYQTLFSLLKAQGYVRAFAGIVLPNAASVGLHEACGFEPVGIYQGVGFKFGRWHDVGWWGFALNDLPEDPSSPIPWSEISAQYVPAT